MAQTLPNGTVVPNESGNEIISATGVAEMRALGGSVDAQLGDRSRVGHTHAWGQITGKPTNFSPSSHTHPASQITDLQSVLSAALAPKANVEAVELGPNADANTLTTPGRYVETNAADAATIVNFPEQRAGILDVAANADRLHVWQVWRTYTANRLYMRSRTGGAWNAWEQIITSTDARLTDARPPSTHTHSLEQVTGLLAALGAKADAEAVELGPGADANTLTTPGRYVETNASAAATIVNFPEQRAGVLDVAANADRLHVWQLWRPYVGNRLYMRSRTGGTWTTWEQVVTGSDARLTNARTPTAHTHPVADVTGLQAEIDSKFAGIASAYDVAYAADPTVGTVDEWLASLVGPRGPEGPYGGTEVADPQVRSILADPASETGQWAARALRRGVSILEHGAVGDGVADDTGALEAALADIAYGGTLYINVPLRTTRPVVVSMPGSEQKRIVFAENGAIRADFTLTKAAVLALTGSANVTIEEPVIVGSGPGVSLASSGLYGIHVTTSSNVRISGGSVTKTHREGLYFEDVAGLKVSNVFLAENAFALRMGAIQCVRTQDTQITGCEVTQSGWKGISASTCDRISVTDCTVHDIAGGDGILLGGCVDYRIVSNTVSNIGGVDKSGDGIKVTEAKADGGAACMYGVVATNTIRGVRDSGAGLRITASQHTLVVGNHISDVDNIGIPIASSVSLDVPIHATDLMITGNVVRGTRGHAIYVGDGSARITITGNDISDVNGSGVLVQAASDIVTTGNVVARTTQPAVRYLSQAATGVARDNSTPGSTSTVGPLVVAGRMYENIQEVTAVRALTNADAGAVLVLRVAGDFTLPEAVGFDAGWNVTIKNVSSGSVSLSRSGANTVDGAASVTVASYGTVRVLRRTASTYITI